MTTIYMLRGLPGSGKTTLRHQLLTDPTLKPITSVNKDEIRHNLGITPGDFDREKEVKMMERANILLALDSGFSVIIDNVHNSPKYRTMYEELAKTYKCGFKVFDLSNVPLEECIRRDSLRPDGIRVGEKVIRQMWQEHYQGK
jgi:predicted kinase